MKPGNRALHVACIALALLTPAMPVTADTLRPFTSDGCSLFPDGTFKDKTRWLHCCTAHDKAYWMGGTREERKQADEALRACVENIGEPQLGEIMRQGVRAGGGPYWPTPYRWGYGWDVPRGYRALSEEEREQAEALLKESPEAGTTGEHTNE